MSLDAGDYRTPYGNMGSEPKINFGWINEAWSLFAAQAGVWIGASAMLLAPVVVVYVLFLGILIGFGLLKSSSGHSSTLSTPAIVTLVVVSVLAVLLVLGATWFLSCGMHLMANKQVRGERIEFKDVFRGGPIFWRVVGTTILTGVSVNVGLCLCVVPGFIVGGLTLPALSLAADGLGVFAAIRRSVDTMKRDMTGAALFYFVLQLILSVGASTFIGIFVVLPLFWLIGTLIYRDMVGMPGAAPRRPAAVPPPPGVWPPPPTVS